MKSIRSLFSQILFHRHPILMGMVAVGVVLCITACRPRYQETALLADSNLSHALKLEVSNSDGELVYLNFLTGNEGRIVLDYRKTSTGWTVELSSDPLPDPDQTRTPRLPRPPRQDPICAVGDPRCDIDNVGTQGN